MKKFLILLVALALVLSALPACAASSFDVDVAADRATAKVGETIEFVVTAQCHDVVALQFELDIPKGLRYVPDSAKLPSGLASKLGIAGSADWTEEMLMFTFYNDVGINIKKGTELLRFSCTVMKEGTYRVSLINCLPFDSNFAEFTPGITAANVKVSGNQQDGQTGNTQTTKPVQKPTEPVVNVTEPQVVPVTEPETEPVTQPDNGGNTEQSPTVGQPTQPEEHTEPVTSPEDGLNENPTDDTRPTNEPPTLDVSIEITEEATEETAPPDQDKNSPSNILWGFLVGVAAVGAIVAVVSLINKKKTSK